MSRRDGQSMKVLKMDIESGKMIQQIVLNILITNVITFVCLMLVLNKRNLIRFYFFSIYIDYTTLFTK